LHIASLGLQIFVQHTCRVGMFDTLIKQEQPLMTLRIDAVALLVVLAIAAWQWGPIMENVSW
jgi:hypothetical protein